MPTIETTAGPIEATELGRTMTHEHVITGPEETRVQWPHAFDRARDIATCITETERMQSFGVETICDPVCSGMGRDVRLNIAVTEATGMRFVIATGLYPAGHQFYWTSPEVLADYFVHDIEVGIQGTDVKAGFIKCAADEPGMVPAIVALHHKVAEVSLSTRTPIMAHTNPRTGVGLEQMRLFTEVGVDPSMIQLAHVGDAATADEVERLLDTGCYVGFDRYGMDDATDGRNDLLLEVLDRGYGDRVMLGHDCSMVWDYQTPEQRRTNFPNWSMTYLFEDVLPRLRDAGVGEDRLDAMLGANVHNWLTGTTPRSANARR